MSKLTERLRAYRLEKGLTLAELGHALRVGQSTVSSWERGEHEPTPRNRTKIQDYLGVPYCAPGAPDVRPLVPRGDATSGRLVLLIMVFVTMVALYHAGCCQ